MIRKLAMIAGVLLIPCSTLLADFSYEETSTITGGAVASMLKVVGVFSKKAREPIHSTIAVKGDKMMHRTADNASIIDLGAQTITSVDFRKKTYSVMTFEQMKQMLEQMSQSAKQNNQGQGQVQFKVSANSTGATRQIAGFDAKEMLVKMEMDATDQQTGQTGGMLITSDMWIAPAVSGYDEVRSFYRRMAEKLNWTPGGNMFMSNPQVSEGMAEVYKEMSKVDGMPVEQMISMGGTGQPTSSSGGQGQAQPEQQQQQQEKPSIGGALGGALGGHFGLGRKKKTQPQEDQSQAQGSQTQSAGSLLEMKTEMSGFSAAAVDGSQFTVPAGFKQVEPDSRRPPR